MSSEWWQSETFWRDIGPFMFNQELLSTAEEDLEDLLEMVDVEDGASVLDVGCAVGRFLLPLARQGYDVVGVDPCDAYRRRARQRALDANLEVDVRARSVLELRLAENERFDLVLDVFAVLGYASNPVNDILAVKAMREALRPAGQLLVRTRHPDTVYGTVKRRAGNATCIEEHTFDRTTNTLHTRWAIVRAGRARVYTTHVRVYTRTDLIELLKFCEMTDIRVFENQADGCMTLSSTRPGS